jgi:WD40 repeat protein
VCLHDRRVLVLRLDTSAALSVARAHCDTVEFVVSRPSTGQLYTGGADRVVMSWEPRSHVHGDIYVPSKRSFKEYSSEILCACLSPNQQLLATGSIDGSLHVWVLDERPDKPVQLLGVCGPMAVAMNGLYEATGELIGGQTRFKGGGLGDKVIEYSSARERWEVVHAHGGKCLAYFASDSSLESCAGSCKWRMMDESGEKYAEHSEMRIVSEKGTADSSLRFTVKAHKARVSSILWHDKTGIITVGWDRVIKTWSAVNGSPLTSTHALHGAVNDAAIDADAVRPQVATVGSDGMLRTWTMETVSCVRGVQVSSRDAQHVKYCAPHDAWVTSSFDMCVRMFDRSLTCVYYVKMNGLSITALAIDSAKGYALVGVNDRQRHMYVVDLLNEATVHKFTGHSDQISSITCTEGDKSRYISTSWDRSLCVWSAVGRRDDTSFYAHNSASASAKVAAAEPDEISESDPHVLHFCTALPFQLS